MFRKITSKMLKKKRKIKKKIRRLAMQPKIVLAVKGQRGSQAVPVLGVPVHLQMKAASQPRPTQAASTRSNGGKIWKFPTPI